MSDVNLSEALLAQMGGQVWQERLKLARPIFDEKIEPESIVTESAKPVSIEVVMPVDTISQPTVQESVLPFILIAAGLEAIWENENSPEWLLLQNIANVFKWDLESLTYFDTDLIATEEAVMMTIEEVFELSINTVFSMDEESMLSEYFSEGFDVISLPSLEMMLSDAYAKKMGYSTLLNQVNS